MTEPMDPHGIRDQIKAGTVKVLRQSLLNSSDICLRRAGYDMQRKERTSGEARCVGTSYHAGLEQYYRSRMEGTETARGLIIDAARAAFDDECSLFDVWETSKGEAWERVTVMVDRYFGNGWHWGLDHEVLGVEQEWFLPLDNGWIIKGSIDLVLRGPDGVVIADHKTSRRRWQKGKEDARKNAQACIYSWAWTTLTGEPVAYGAFDVQTYGGVFERRLSYPTPAHIAAVMDKAMSVAKIFENLPPEQLPCNPSSNLCSATYCDAWLICPMGGILAPEAA